MHSLDLGGTTVDMVYFDEKNKKVIETFSALSSQFPKKNILDILEYFSVTQKIIKEKKIIITGGNTHQFPDEVFIGSENIEIKIIKVHEFEAIAKGAQFLSDEKSGLAISMGTGTAMVQFDEKNWKHVNGTGIGGGTFLALGRALLRTDNFDELQALVEKGNENNIDISIGDIVGQGIGNLPKEATASNFGKYSENSSRPDIALGIANIIAQSIATLAVEKSARLRLSTMIIGGKFSRLEILKRNIRKTCRVLGIDSFFPKYSGFMTCIGASVTAMKK